MKLTFLGGTGTVTGSKYLLQDGTQSILIDAGLFQGQKPLRERNWQPLPIDPAKLDAVLLTHAHIDHSGYIPKLAAEGFSGPVYCSDATLDLCRILLPDSGHIQEEDAEEANRYGYSRHTPALPLYTEQQARDCLSLFRPVGFGKTLRLGKTGELDFSLHRAGHILGAASIRVSDGQTAIVFSGDLGRSDDPLMKDPVPIQDADYIVCESTYGNKTHDRTDPADAIGAIIRATAARGGTVIIPAFAVGRAQTLMYYMHRLKRENKIPLNLPIYLDSPMAINVSALMTRHLNDHRLPEHLCAEIAQGIHQTLSREESKRIDAESSHMPAVIISASGMATGGRVLHHLKRFIGDPKHTVLLAGFQAEGTRGRHLAEGAASLKIHGAEWPVRAQIASIDSLSAHGDSDDIMRWLGHFVKPPRRVYLTHGEPAAAAALQSRIMAELDWDAVVPAYGDIVEI